MSRLSAIIVTTAFVFTGLKAQKVMYNFDVNPSWGEFEEVVDVWTQFVASETDSAGAEFWNRPEVKKYGRENYFLLNSEYNPNLLRMAKFHNIQILSIIKEDSLHKITSHFFYPKNDTLMTLCIIEVYVGPTQEGYKLYNALPINLKKHWQSTTVGYIRFHYPRYHEFNREKARKQNAFITETLPSIFDTRPDSVDYFFAGTRQELEALRGFVFNVGGSGTVKPSGKAAPGNIVYAVGTGEYYPHELVHVFVDPLQNPKHPWVGEGLATYLGGSRGKSLSWHIKRTHAYLEQHPEIDLNNMLDLLTIDEYTEYRYVLGGLVIKLIHDERGWDGVKAFIREVEDQEGYYQALEKYLGWKRQDLNKEVRRALAILSME